MTLGELLAEASRLGIQLEAEGAEVRYRALVGAVTEERKDDLRAHKVELRKLFTAAPADSLSDRLCPVCGGHERWEWFDGGTLCRVCSVLDLTPITMIRQGWDRSTRQGEMA